jgi:hypothetical protein
MYVIILKIKMVKAKYRKGIDAFDKS